MKFEPRSAATRQFIIETSAELFNKKGFSATSVTDIKKVTGLTKGSIYGNFENKDAVALAVFDYNLDIKLSYIKEKQDLCGTFKDKLLTHVLVHYPIEKAPFTPGGCPMLNTGVEAAYLNQQLKTRAAEGLIKWTEMISDLVAGGIHAGEFKADADPLATALQVISLLEGGALYARTTENYKYAKKLLEAAQRVITAICL